MIFTAYVTLFSQVRTQIVIPGVITVPFLQKSICSLKIFQLQLQPIIFTDLAWTKQNYLNYILVDWISMHATEFAFVLEASERMSRYSYIWTVECYKSLRIKLRNERDQEANGHWYLIILHDVSSNIINIYFYYGNRVL